jgi:hypothetical protein
VGKKDNSGNFLFICLYKKVMMLGEEVRSSDKQSLNKIMYFMIKSYLAKKTGSRINFMK